jgi:hypothetical protein
MEGSVKKIKITGGAAEMLMKTNKTRRRALRGVSPRGEEQPQSFMAVPVPVHAPAPTPTPAPASVTTAPVIHQDAGAKPVKVILDPSKKRASKLVLSPPKTVVKLPAIDTSAPHKRNNKTQKISRRIRVSVDGMKKRVFRAKTIKKESQKMPIEQLKKELEAAGLIKVASKAPEPILRQMYSDFQVLKQRAL